jgi:hypothetical protein
MSHPRTLVLLLLCLTAESAAARVVRTAHFVITIPERVQSTSIGEQLERAYARCREYGLSMPASVAVTVHGTTGEFAAVSGASRMHIAAVRSGRMHLQPVDVLRRHATLEQALVHEMTHVALAAAGDRMPRWLGEGFAMTVAGQMHPVQGSYRSTEEIDRAMASGKGHAGLRRAYGSAERLVRALVERIGRQKLLGAIEAIAGGSTAAAAFRAHGSIDIDAWTKERLAGTKSARKAHQR